MAETLTYDPGTDTVTEGEALTPAEQESLEVGQALEDSQEQLLAGKYKDAADLEKAYIELQKKLGEDGKEIQDNKAEAEQEEVLQETPEEESSEASEAAQLITSASDEYWKNDGKLSEETMGKFASLSSQDLVNAYMELQSKNPDAQSPAGDAEDISDATVNQIKNYAGGEKAYSDMVNWASNNLDDNSIAAFDNIINSGSVDAIKLAVNGLKSQYQDANGYEGTMLTGKAPVTSRDSYKSQAELVQAMSDRRYDRDPAYRQSVMEKLERSDNLSF